MPLIAALIGRGRENSVDMKPAWSTTANFRPAVSEGYKQTKYSLKVFFSFNNSNTTAFLNLCFYIKASLNLTLNCSYMLIYCKKN